MGVFNRLMGVPEKPKKLEGERVEVNGLTGNAVEQKRKADAVLFAHERLDTQEKRLSNLEGLVIDRFDALDKKVDASHLRNAAEGIRKQIKEIEEVNEMPVEPEVTVETPQLVPIQDAQPETIAEDIVESPKPQDKEYVPHYSKTGELINEDEKALENDPEVVQRDSDSAVVAESLEKISNISDYDIGKIPAEITEDFYFETLFKGLGTLNANSIFEPELEFTALRGASVFDLAYTAQEALRSGYPKEALVALDRQVQTFEAIVPIGVRAESERKRTRQINDNALTKLKEDYDGINEELIMVKKELSLLQNKQESDLINQLPLEHQEAIKKVQKELDADWETGEKDYSGGYVYAITRKISNISGDYRPLIVSLLHWNNRDRILKYPGNKRGRGKKKDNEPKEVKELPNDVEDVERPESTYDVDEEESELTEKESSD
jgi:hypothetical protein